MAVVHLDHVTVRSYNSSFTRRHYGASQLFLIIIIKGNSPSLLDLIFTNEDNLIDQMSYGAPIGKSDHVSVTFNYTTRIEEEQSDVIKLNYWKGNYGKINEELGKIN